MNKMFKKAASMLIAIAITLQMIPIVNLGINVAAATVETEGTSTDILDSLRISS